MKTYIPIIIPVVAALLAYFITFYDANRINNVSRIVESRKSMPKPD
jgi:hypothetical protein